jgi:hypothetical protein
LTTAMLEAFLHYYYLKEQLTGQVNDSEQCWQLSDTVLPMCGVCNQLTVHICIRIPIFWDVTQFQFVFSHKHSSQTSCPFIWKHYVPFKRREMPKKKQVPACMFVKFLTVKFYKTLKQFDHFFCHQDC